MPVYINPPVTNTFPRPLQSHKAHNNVPCCVEFLLPGIILLSSVHVDSDNKSNGETVSNPSSRCFRGVVLQNKKLEFYSGYRSPDGDKEVVGRRSLGRRRSFLDEMIVDRERTFPMLIYEMFAWDSK